MNEDALSAAITWVAALLTGTMATTIAVLAVAAIGMLALAGRLAARRAGSVILGCFVLFAAPTIAQGLLGGGAPTPVPDLVVEAPVPVASYTPRLPTPNSYDPYAGASVPSIPDPQPQGIIR